MVGTRTGGPVVRVLIVLLGALVLPAGKLLRKRLLLPILPPGPPIRPNGKPFDAESREWISNSEFRIEMTSEFQWRLEGVPKGQKK